MRKSVATRLGLTRNVRPGRARRRSVGWRVAGWGVAPTLLLLAGTSAAGVHAAGAASNTETVDTDTVDRGTVDTVDIDPVDVDTVNINTVVDDQTLFTLHGHGHGHGRGMGQWGSFGYAQQGWSAEQILGHYYGDTELGVLEPTEITVRLMFRDGKPLEVHSAGPLTVAGQSVAPGQAARLVPTAGGAQAQIMDSCDGQVLWEGETADPWVYPASDSPARLCGEDATYRGALGVALEGGEARTVSKLDIEDYLRGVVPSEVPASWADQGGAEALKAQTVAARSYAAAETRKGYAKTCDTQACQVYRGADKDDARADAAIAATRGQVLTRAGAVVPAEFSASTGGWSASGDFPSVADEGDAISPTKDWTKRFTAREIADAFEVGELLSMEVVETNGLGSGGGRVLVLRVEGTTRTVEVSGDDARTALSLKSDWFRIEGQEPALAADSLAIGEESAHLE